MPSASPQRTPQPRRGRSSVNGTPSSTRSTRSAVRTPSSNVSGGSRGATPRGGDGELSTPRRSQPASGNQSSGELAPPSDSDDRTYTGPALGDGMIFNLSSPLHYGSDTNSPRSATPHRQRTDLRMERSVVRQINISTPASSQDHPESVPSGTPSRRGRSRALSATPGARPDSVAEDEGPHLVIWGTNVAVGRTKRRFMEFFLNFRESELEEDEQNRGMDVDAPVYMQRIEDIAVTEDPFLMVNCAHLRSFDQELYEEVVAYPSEVIPVLDIAVNDIYRERHSGTVLKHQICVKPYNADKTQNMRELGPENIDQLITVCGMVIRCSNPLPEMREALFMCSVCLKTEVAEMDRNRLEEPTLCSHCNTKHSFELVHNRCQFTDRQIIKLQEAPEDMPAGQTPHTVQLHVSNELVDEVQPGDRVTVTGIYRAVPFRVNPIRTSVKAVFRTHIDVLHFRKADSRRLRDDQIGGIYFTEDRIEFLQALSKKPDIYERLARAIAPSIYEHEDIKKGILMQLFGGTKKDFSEDCGRGHFRSEINILLCGDPGTSKSQLLQCVFNLIPRSQYTSGKGSSAVGLTAYVLRDPDTKQLVLQTGALVLADNGICCIDEFDKMSDATRSVLHEVMEQQTLSIAKAGMICQLNARTSVLAAANPIDSQWNKSKTIVENIQLPHTLLSRFDLIFLMLDPQDEVYDRRLAKHLVSLYHKRIKSKTTVDGMEVEDVDDDDDDVVDRDLIDMTVLRDYIAYGREHVNPILSEEASAKLVDAYVEMRRAGAGRGQITAYPRQLESLMRLAEAHAKMRLSSTVERADVDEAFRLYREALKQSATDPTSGKIDVSILTTGMSSAARKRRAEVAQALRTLIAKKGKNVKTLSVQNLFTEFRDSSELAITRDMFDDALRDLQDDTFLVVSGRSVRINGGMADFD